MKTPCFKFLLLSLAFALYSNPLVALEVVDSGELNAYEEAIKGLDPMDLSGLDPKVAGLLRKYYHYTFGDALIWESVESLRIEGELLLQGKTLDCVVYMKKPNNLKSVVYFEDGERLVLGYDGKEAWQHNTRNAMGPVTMAAVDAIEFIRDAHMGGHLLYPQLRGKVFEFVGPAKLEGDRVYELKTTLPGGQVIRSFFDMTSFAELYQITVSNRDGTELLKKYLDFRKVGGVRSPFTTITKSKGALLSQFRTTSLRFNAGVASWIFARPYAASSIDNKPIPIVSSADELNDSFESSKFSEKSSDIWSINSEMEGSGFQLDSASPSSYEFNLPDPNIVINGLK